MFEKRGDQVSYFYLKTYDKDTIRILRETKAEHNQMSEKGYTRQQACKEFFEAQLQINSST